MAGLILVGMGMARLGTLIQVVPYPVTIGFTAGIGVVIATLQIKDFLGLNIGLIGGHYIGNIETLVNALPTLLFRGNAYRSSDLYDAPFMDKAQNKDPLRIL